VVAVAADGGTCGAGHAAIVAQRGTAGKGRQQVPAGWMRGAKRTLNVPDFPRDRLRESSKA
jgi:hypothetical protein